MEEILTVSVVAAGVPANKGRLFAAEAVAVRPGGEQDRFTLAWVRGRACPHELWRHSGEHQRGVEVETEGDLLRQIRAWIRHRPYWTLDPYGVAAWIDHGVEESVPALDAVLAAQVLSAGNEAVSASEVARHFGRLGRWDRPAGSFRATEVVDCLKGLASRFALASQERPAWATLALDCLSRGKGDVLGTLASNIRSMLVGADRLLLTPALLPLADLLQEDRERIVRMALTQPLPEWVRRYNVAPRPAAANPTLTSDALVAAITTVFATTLPISIRTELAGTAALHDAGRAATDGPPVPGLPQQVALLGDVAPASRRQDKNERHSEQEVLRRMTDRPGQRAMAAEVARAVVEGETLLAEAETGTGKTLAYLIPAAIASVARGQRLIISTYSRALQDQIATKDAIYARDALGMANQLARPIRITVIKGSSNYVCLQALVDALSEAPAASVDALAHVAVLSSAIFDPLGELPDPPLTPRSLNDAVRRLKRRVQSAGGCGSHRRSELGRCPHDLAKAASAEADIVVCNHAWLLATNLGDRDVLIVDEADQLLDVAEDSFALEASVPQLQRIAKELAGESDTVAGRLGRLVEDHVALGPCIDELLHQSVSLGHAAQQLNEAAARWSDRQASNHTASTGKFEFTTASRAEAAGAALVDACAEAAAQLAKLPGLFQQVTMLIGAAGARLGRTKRALERSVAELQLDAERWLDTALSWGQVDGTSDSMLTLEHQRWGWHLRVDPLLVGPLLAKKFKPIRSLIYCSATLSVSGDFGLFRARSGVDDLAIERTRIREFRAASPFDYKAAMHVGIPTDISRDPLRRQKTLADAVVFAAERTRGRLLVLFTSIEEMDRVYEAVEAALAALAIPVYKATGDSADSVAARFRAEVHSVAFGVRSFWHGVDFPGETLEWIFVSKLPYEPWDKNRRRREAVKARYGIPERDYYTWSMMLMLKQGLGRLIRTTRDRGTAIVFDSRLATEPGLLQLFEAILPEGIQQSGEPSKAAVRSAPLADLLEAAFTRHKLLPDIVARGLTPRLGVQKIGDLHAGLAEAVEVAAKHLNVDECDQARRAIQPFEQTCIDAATANITAARGALLVVRLRVALGDIASALGLLEALTNVPFKAVAQAARELRIETIAGAQSPLDLWQSISSATLPDGVEARTREACLFSPEDGKCAAWWAVAGWSREEPPLAVRAVVMHYETDPGWALAAYVTCVHAMRTMRVIIPESVAAIVVECSRFGVPAAALPDILITCLAGEHEQLLGTAAGALLDNIPPDEILQLPDASLFAVGKGAAALRRYELLHRISLEAERRIDEAHASRDASVAVRDLHCCAFELAVANGRTAEVTERLRILSAFASRYQFNLEAAEALDAAPLSGWPRQLARELFFTKVRLLAQSGEVGTARALALLEQEANRCLAADDHLGTQLALDEMWLLSPRLEVAAQLDERFRRAAPSVPPVEARAEALGVAVPPGRYLVVGGDPPLESRVRKRLPPGASVVWITSERGQRPDYARLDDLLADGKFDSIVLLTHHISHALSNHVTKRAARGDGIRLSLPKLPGIQGVLQALFTGSEVLH